MTLQPTTDLRRPYRPMPGHFDEFVSDGEVRGPWAHVADGLDRLGPDELPSGRDESRRLLADDGVTYNVTTAESSSRRPWLLDPVPVVISTRGVGRHRGRPRPAGRAARPGPHRPVRAPPAGGRGPDPARAGLRPSAGSCASATDPASRASTSSSTRGVRPRARARTGPGRCSPTAPRPRRAMGYALGEPRSWSHGSCPSLYRESPGASAWPRSSVSCGRRCRRVAPTARTTPRIVVLTPGPWSETAFEHALAGLLPRLPARAGLRPAGA